MKVLPIAAVVAALLATVATAAKADTRPIIPAPHTMTIGTVEQILNRVGELGYRRILEIERKGDLVQVEALDAEGRPVDLYFDKDTGAEVK